MSDELTELAAELQRVELEGGESAFGVSTSLGRVIATHGFSNWDSGRLAVIESDGRVRGSLLGDWGAARLVEAVGKAPPGVSTTVTLDVNGRAVAEAGLTCGGEARVLIQPLDTVPAPLWRSLADRAPVALLSPLSGTGASTVVEPDGTTVGPAPDAAALQRAVEILDAGQAAVEQLGDVLLEVWVPPPRIVTVGTGELAGAIERQSALLGWETRIVEDLRRVDEALTWAGASAALVVLSHDPHVDCPALATGLRRQVPYVGALGSRRTQSGRTERLLAAGVDAEALERIHRPIGLDLGGRRAPDVALAICAEILASRHSRDARSLRSAPGPIHHESSVRPPDERQLAR